MTSPQAGRRRQPGWYIPWLLLPPFLVVLAANGALVHYAFSSFSGLTSEHASEEGAHYNAALAAAKAQAERGWQVSISFAGAGPLKGRVEADLRDRDGKPLTGAEVSASLLRPTSAGADEAVRLAETGGGHYGAGIAVRMPGIWDLRLVVRHPAGSYQQVKRITVAE